MSDRSAVNLCKKHVAFLSALGANIFVSSDGLLKLGDFGSSIKLKNPLQTVYGEISNIRGTVGEQDRIMKNGHQVELNRHLLSTSCKTRVALSFEVKYRTWHKRQCSIYLKY